MSNFNKLTFSEFLRNSAEDFTELPEYLSVIDMNTITESINQSGGNIETSTEQWNDYISNQKFNTNMLDTLSTPTNTAALEDRLVKLFEEAENNEQKGGAYHSMSRPKKSKSKGKSKKSKSKKSKKSKSKKSKSKKSKSKSKKSKSKTKKSKSKTKKSKQKGGAKKSKSKSKAKSKGKSKSKSKAKSKGKSKSKKMKSKKSKSKMSRQNSMTQEAKPKKKTNPGFQAYLDFKAKAAKKVVAAGGPKGGPPLSRYIKQFTDKAKSSLGPDANSADVYAKALKLLDEALKTATF